MLQNPWFNAALPRLASAALVCLAGLPASAQAQAFDAVRLYGAAPGQDGGIIGLGLVSGMTYRGSDERRTRVFPLIDYQWANGWFAGTGNGIGYNFGTNPALHYGLRLTADLGRRESASNALKGMGDIPVRPELGGFANLAVSRSLFLTSSLRYGAGQTHNGLVVDLGAGYSAELAPQWRLGLGGAFSIVNASLMRSSFGVNAEQAVSANYPEYAPGSGLRDLRANLALTWQFMPRATLTMAVSDTALLDKAKASPLVRKSNAVSGVIGAGWAF